MCPNNVRIIPMISKNKLFVRNGEEQLSDQRGENAALWSFCWTGKCKLFFKETGWILDERKRHEGEKSIIICNRILKNCECEIYFSFLLNFLLFNFNLDIVMNHFRWSFLICKCDRTGCVQTGILTYCCTVVNSIWNNMQQ